MRLSAASLDIDAFRSFIEAAGGAFEEAKPSAGEVLRFRVGYAFGCVSQRKDGSLTLTGEAKPIFRKFSGGKMLPYVIRTPGKEQSPPAPPAKIITYTMPVADLERAKSLLAPARTATVYTDGSATYGGLGFGGWAAVIKAGFITVEIYGGAKNTTVNRMEIIAALVALEALPPTCATKIKTDSKYLRDGITKWIDGWKRRGWMTFAREPVKNDTLWQRLDAARAGREVLWQWVKGHSGNKHNDRADELAKEGRYAVQRQTAKPAEEKAC
jgi:ribonuclease HI